MNFHGKVIEYEETANFLKSLPKRRDFIDKDLHKQISKNITDNLPIWILANDLIEKNMYVENKYGYTIILYSIIASGSKVCIMIVGIEPFFELKCPYEDIDKFSNDIQDIIKAQNCKYSRIEIHEHFPFKRFQEQPSKYLRIYFQTTKDRKEAIEYFRGNYYEYFVDKKRKSIKLETVYDDISCYYRKVAREYKINLCGWNEITNYEVIKNDNIKNCDYTFKVHIDNIKCVSKLGIDIQADKKYLPYFKDRTVNCLWDTETYSFHPTGNPPTPHFIFNKKGEEEDIVFMESMQFCWHFSRTPFLTINLTLLPSPIIENCLTIICPDQITLIRTMSLILERISPDFMCDFNGGVYDWPFIIKRMHEFDKIKKTNLTDMMKKRFSCYTYTDSRDNYIVKGEDFKDHKMEAGRNKKDYFFRVPGTICIDVRTQFMKLYPTAEKSNLNFFLSLNKLESKEDMKYTLMFVIVTITLELISIFKTRNYNKIIEKLTNLELEDPEQKILTNKLYKVNTFKISEIIKHVELIQKVVIYCNVDALRCQDLLVIRSIIPDKREVSKLAYTSMYDAIFNAGGMKVRNLVIATANENEWNIAISNISKEVKDPRKYPGAMVIPPKKGCYRDHKFIKRSRRKSYTDKHGKVPDKDLDPMSGSFRKELLEDDFNNKYPLLQEEILNNDTNDETDRPCAGLDFSSLYPNTMITYNLSPEKYVETNRYDSFNDKTDKYNKKYNLKEVDFYYGLGDEDNKEHIHGYFIQHHPVETIKENKSTWDYEGMGLYPFILKWLYDERARLKKKLEYYGSPKEFLESLFGNKGIGFLRRNNQEEEKQFIIEKIDEQIINFDLKYKETNKQYFKNKIHYLNEVKEFFKIVFINNFRIDDFYDEISFQYNYFNTKQNALKTFMNIFYGETGSSLSSFFLVHLAGGVTQYGRRNLLFIKDHTEKRKFKVKYGDTDSLYISPPDSCFETVDKLYLTGQISKLEWWTKMIEISMDVLDEYKDTVSRLLFEDNGTWFLKMAYEEILWPYVFVGKKKYAGVQHQGIINLSISMTECKLEDFMKSKSLFIRGLETRKRGCSDFSKINVNEVLKEAFCIDTTETLKQICIDKLDQITKREFPKDKFTKTAQYREPGWDYEREKVKPGNPSVNTFVRRMTEIYETNPKLGILPPEIGERFSYFIAEKYPYTYTITGKKEKLKTGDKYEYPDSMENENYKQYIGEELNIDINHYVTQELIGQIARFVLYHPEYNKYFQAYMYDDDDAYKEADKKAHGDAKKQLIKYYNENYGMVFMDKKKVYKQVYNIGKEKLTEILEDKYGDASCVFNIVEKLITTDDVTNKFIGKQIIETFKVSADKEAKKNACSYLDEVVKKKDSYKIWNLFVVKENGILKIWNRDYRIREQIIIGNLTKQLPKFEKLCSKYHLSLEKTVNIIRKVNKLDEVGKKPLDDESECIMDLNIDYDTINDYLHDEYPEELIDEDLDIIYDIYNTYIDLVSIRTSIMELDLHKEKIAMLKNKNANIIAAPPRIKEEISVAGLMDFIRNARKN